MNAKYEGCNLAKNLLYNQVELVKMRVGSEY